MSYLFKYNEQSFCEDVMYYATHYHRKYERFYHSDYQGDELKSKTVLHAIFHYTLNLANQTKKERGCYKKDIHRQLKLLKMDIPSSYDYFTAVLKEMNNGSIQEVLKHGAKGEPKQKLKKFNPVLIDQIDVIYANNPLKTYRQIHELVIQKAEKKNLWGIPSIHFIKRHLANTKRQRELRVVKNGESHYRKTIAKQMHFSAPEFAGQLLEIDGSRLQIPYNNEEKKRIDFLTIFVIIDVTSSEVLGYSHGHYESSSVVVNAFKRFFYNHSFLPLQITRDGSSAFKKDFIFMEDFMTSRGVNWVITHNPQGKPHVENFYKIFTKSICSYHEAFIGLGITATHIDSRITDKKELRKRIGDRNNLSTYKELVIEIDFLLSKYSNAILNGSESPQMKFERKFDLSQVIKLSQADKTAMTGVYKSMVVSNCELRITYTGQNHFYQIPGNDGESIKEVFVAHDNENFDKIHLYKDHYEYWQTVKEYEVMPVLASQRTSSQQERYIRELSARKNRYKQLVKNVKDKERRVAKASSNDPSFEVIRIHRNKEDEINAQNEFTRSLLEEEQTIQVDELNQLYPPNSVKTEVSNIFVLKKIDKWNLKSNG